MFSIEDIREFSQAFPPPTSHHGLPPSLVLDASGQGFITFEQLRIDYERHVANEIKRIPVSQLASELDLTSDTLRTLVRTGRPLVLLSNDESEIIPIQEVEASLEKLREELRTSIVSMSEIKSEYGISNQHRLWDELGDVVMFDDHACTRAYDEEISKQALSVVNRAVEGVTNIDVSAKDLEDLPGSPPKWRFLHHLKALADSSEYADKVFVRETRDCIRVQSKQMRQRVFQEWSDLLSSGEIAYVDIEPLVSDHAVYDSTSEAINDFKKLTDVEIVDEFAISEAWFSNFVKDKLQVIQKEDMWGVDIANGLSERVKSSTKSKRSMPESLYNHIQRKAEQHLTTALTQRSNDDHRRYGMLVLTAEGYRGEECTLSSQASKNAERQWAYLKCNPAGDIKFLMNNIILPNNAIQAALANDKALAKTCERSFWATIQSLETLDEADFATYWTDRVTSRLEMYTTGLESIPDLKLKEQLNTLLATYLQSDMLPDALSKARAQNLVMSRKTRKNIDKLETALKATKDLSHILSTLEKFTTKQSISPLLARTSPKKSMLADMQRRMAKTSDPPVLFLTLVVLLYARYYPGVVYATGKFAPKLMKLLREKVSAEEYAVLEGWKEGAKKGELGEEDREGMRAMAKGQGEGEGEV
ncbi:hypothetical protein HBH56_009280 [Parastagonospora nodorum]|uniref:Uncharacterized protein n=1 Tax=Phaeosphaeria nodorum (strain SN15 / ATCC MYA-4574 / FGSC 10173) TaxID=321614 RepID=A0A7U2EPK4_PHANO|nr:hypothetical protein HBH56_009280 [Parastagonospora nodorum]QRC90653.1 hypothetical protein JI435_001760 [Parastagonospora nodorum SN15]KAH3935316.1 hypothetical protein HBH54_042570 [Parastagonospora nodorum]KAH4145966.1 hypothetical protein HBH45_003180 [Parastagonospora nodorum]KAH4169999.1 hypothetical protein HBH44_032980 [Parastagonospora nodorum]